MFGLSQQTVNVTIRQSPSEIIADATSRLLEVIDAEVIDEPRGIGS